MSRRQRRARSERRRHAARWARRGAATGGLAAAATLLSGAVADAATFTVTNTNDSGAGSLRNAITYANVYGLLTTLPSTIVFQSGMSGTIALQSSLPQITSPLTVDGPGALTMTVSGAGAFQPFYIASGLKGTSQIAGLTINNGSAADGGGIRAGSPLILTGDNSGGGVYAAQGLTVQNSTISSNNASEGAGLHVLYGLTAQNSTIATNTASADGGGIFHSGVGMTITDSTISGNAANGATNGNGGGISAGGSGANVLQNTIVSGNTAAVNGPDVYTASGGSPPTASFSLIGSTSGSSLTTDGTDIVGQDPMLGSVSNNGGATPTMAPPFNSPVIDRGSSFGLGTDQRGAPRPTDLPGYPNAPGGDGSDIGAVELQPSEVVPTVSGLSRTSGTQGAAINVFGSRLSNATQVLFGSTPVGFSVVNQAQLNVTVPAGSGTVDVRVVTPGGISATGPTDRFTYLTAAQQAAAPPSPHTVTKRFGNQKLTLTVPSLSTCTAKTGALGALLNTTTSYKGTKLRFVRASYYLDKGVKHTSRKTVRLKNGRKKRVTVVTYTPNLYQRLLPSLWAFGLRPFNSGWHVLKVVMSYNKTVVRNHRKKTVTATTTISARFDVC